MWRGRQGLLHCGMIMLISGTSINLPQFDYLGIEIVVNSIIVWIFRLVCNGQNYTSDGFF